ncbi:MAG TPA: beta-carotene 15,15'-dioxygenase, Brp/Blh family [Mycobacterium sp.]|nr:beta-carotene 15,15'-dioxygenase, Brp/Blh family [Mycobacterium sp.]
MAITTRPARVRRWHGRESPPGAGLPGDSAPAAHTQPLALAAAWSRRLVVFTVLLATGATYFQPALAGPVVLALAGVGLAAGIPHGAIDHLAAARIAGGRSIFVVAVAYAGLAAAAWVLMVWAGPVALLAVVVLSALHFGLGELEVARQLTGWRPGAVVAAAITVAGCGALLLPLARCGDQLSGVAAAVSPDIVVLLEATWVQIGLVVTWLVATLVAVAGSLRSGYRAVAVDIALVGFLGALAPPLVAFAVWFGGWHALRHCARMLTVEPSCAELVAAGRQRAAVGRFVRLAAWPSAAALTVVAALGWFTVVATDPTALLAEVLRLLLALTLPHMVVVLWLDRTTNR